MWHIRHVNTHVLSKGRNGPGLQACPHLWLFNKYTHSWLWSRYWSFGPTKGFVTFSFLIGSRGNLFHVLKAYISLTILYTFYVPLNKVYGDLINLKNLSWKCVIAVFFTLEEKSLYSWSDSPGSCCVMGAFPLVNKVTCSKEMYPLLSLKKIDQPYKFFCFFKILTQSKYLKLMENYVEF